MAVMKEDFIHPLAKPEFCRLCKTCELICSYHHLGIFNPELAFVSANMNERGDAIMIFKHGCDNCNKCVQHCPFGALKVVKK